MTTLRPDTEALLALLRPEPERSWALRHLDALVPVERDRLLERLRHHGLGGWAHKVLDAAGIVPPEELAAPLAADHRATLARNIVLLSAYEKVSAALSEAGVDHIPLKGIQMLGTLYGDLGTRVLSDIDLLVREGDLERAGEVLCRLGTPNENDLERDRHKRFHHHYTYALKGPLEPHLELHFRFSSYHGRSEPLERLWDRTTADPGCFHARQLDPTDRLAGLLVHATHHGFRMSAKWLLDLRLLLDEKRDEKRDGGSVSPMIFSEFAEARHIVSASALVLGLTARLTDSAPARDLEQALAEKLSQPHRRALELLTAPALILERGELLEGKWAGHALRVLLADGARAKAAAAWTAVGFKAHLEGWLR